MRASDAAETSDDTDESRALLEDEEPVKVGVDVEAVVTDSDPVMIMPPKRVFEDLSSSKLDQVYSLFGVKMTFLAQLRKVFTTPKKAAIFFSYCMTFCVILILTGLSKRTSGGDYAYDPMVVVILTEFGKLTCAIALSLSLYNLGPVELVVELFNATGRRAALLYIIPAGLYALNNNLAFVNLLAFDPATYTVLTQFRIVVTGIAFQILFKRRLTRLQWISLVFLTLGCIVKELGAEHPRTKVDTPVTTDKPGAEGKVVHQEEVNPWSRFLDPRMLILLLQTVCSSSAGVYNEFLLKEKAASTPLMLQNIYMCCNSIVINFMTLFALGKGPLVIQSFGVVFSQPITLGVAAATTTYGLITSILLKELNSILKTYAAAVEIFACGVLSHLFLGTKIDASSVWALVIVSFACYLYVKQPVVNYASSDWKPSGERLLLEQKSAATSSRTLPAQLEPSSELLIKSGVSQSSLA